VTPRGRWSLIALGAIATGIAAYFSPDNREQREATAIAQREPVPRGIEWPVRRALGRQRADLFAPHSPPPARPPQPEPQQQTAAPAPPNPFRFAGSVEYGGRRRVLFTRADRIFEVDEGATLDEGFRVQTITPQEVTLLYEPLNASVSVALVFQEPAPQAAAAGGPSAPAGSGARPPH
jgi:hypothetical protein